MRVVFAGTPEPAVIALQAIVASRHELVGVVTRPDAPAGRGRKLVASPVAQYAEELGGIEILKPVKPSDPEFLARLREIAPDCCPVVAYGGLLPQAALDIPQHGWINLHFSVLPAWRGAAPVQHSIIAGDDVTGASTFRIVKALDAGPVYGVLTEPIGPEDTSGDLLHRLAVSGVEAARRHARRDRGRRPGGPRAAGRRDHVGAEAHGRGRRAGSECARAASRSAGARLQPGARGVDDVPWRAAEGARRTADR